MSFAFLPLFTGDYLKKTRHLTPQKHGVYLLLLIHCWDTKGPLPFDEQECAGIANCRSADEIDSLRYILAKYFIRMEDGWYNERCQQEIEKSIAIADKRADAGRIGGTVRAKHLKEKKNEASANQTLANAKQVSLTLTPTLTPTLTLTDNVEPSAKGRGSRFALTAPPDSWRTWTGEHFPTASCDRTFARFRDHWIAQPGQKGVKTDWFATWRNWLRRDNPAGDVDADAELVASVQNDPRFKEQR